MVPRIAVGDVDQRLIGLFFSLRAMVAVILSAYGEGSGIEVHTPFADINEDLSSTAGDACEKTRHIVLIESIEGTPEAIVVEVTGLLTPSPSSRWTGLFSKNCGTRYNRRLEKPRPFSTMATVAVPTLTRWREGSVCPSSNSASPISRQIPATMPR